MPSLLADNIPWVTPPNAPIFRVGRAPDPFAVTDWKYAGADGTFGNRFDDPGDSQEHTDAVRFRTIYCAAQRACAFGETVSRFRPSLETLAQLEFITDDEPIPSELTVGKIDEDWRSKRRLGQTLLDPSLRFVDLMSPTTHQIIRHHLGVEAHRLGLPDVDLSTVMGATPSHRKFTNLIARFIYEIPDPRRQQPAFAGLRYTSRLNPEWECWAIYADRIQHRPCMPERILADDPGLIEAAQLFNLKIATFQGRSCKHRACTAGT